MALVKKCAAGWCKKENSIINMLSTFAMSNNSSIAFPSWWKISSSFPIPPLNLSSASLLDKDYTVHIKWGDIYWTQPKQFHYYLQNRKQINHDKRRTKYIIPVSTSSGKRKSYNNCQLPTKGAEWDYYHYWRILNLKLDIYLSTERSMFFTHRCHLLPQSIYFHQYLPQKVCGNKTDNPKPLEENFTDIV